MIITGKTPLQRLLAFNPKAKGWYTKTISAFMDAIIRAFRLRNEVLGGCTALADGSGDTTMDHDHFEVGMTGNLATMLNGRLMAEIAAFAAAGSALDLLDDEETGIGQPIFSDGSSADIAGGEWTGLADDAIETCYGTLIACNSDNEGGADEDDNGAPLLVLVIAGTGTTYGDAEAHLTSAEIQDALEASTDIHDGVTGWTHVAQIVFTSGDGDGTCSGEYVLNRNNVLEA